MIWPQKQDRAEDEKLCVFLVEKALSKLPSGVDHILVIVNLRGLRRENADFMFLKFLVNFPLFIAASFFLYCFLAKFTPLVENDNGFFLCFVGRRFLLLLP